MENLYVPLVTPFTDDTSSLSETRFARLVRLHMSLGAKGFAVCGRTGEVHALSLSERKQLVEWAVREAHGLPVIVNVTASTTSAVVDLSQHADRHGCQAVVFGMPPAVSLTKDETEGFVTAVRRHGNIPCAFLDQVELSQEAVVAFPIYQIESHANAPIAVFNKITPDEYAFNSGSVWPVSVFGVRAAHKALANWDLLGPRIKALFGHGGTFRVAKALLEHYDLDVGHTRGPVRDLDATGLQLLNSLWSELT